MTSSAVPYMTFRKSRWEAAGSLCMQPAGITRMRSGCKAMSAGSYVGSIVLGLTDALVELTGTLAGLTPALQNVRLVAISGLIAGIAAAFSMAASEYLPARADNNAKAGHSALYTGAAYLITVALLTLPCLLVPQAGPGIFVSLAITVPVAVLIILGFTFCVSVAKNLPFRRRSLEILGISMGVSAFSFLVGLLVRSVSGMGFSLGHD
jgi:VIT1/CCC1 family predicted Fe2+/Mn2+ transporter